MQLKSTSCERIDLIKVNLMKLHNFFRSSTSHRLRIALNLKGLEYEYVAINLRKDEHLRQTFKLINPQGFVPALETDDEILIQTPAILEWLEEKYPSPPLLPENLIDRQHVRALAAIVGCDIHPLNNKRILDKLRAKFKADNAAINEWASYWITAAFDTFEALLNKETNRGIYCFGNKPSLADVYLIPQIESAKRFKVDLINWPQIKKVEDACLNLEAFIKAAPSQQIDAIN